MTFSMFIDQRTPFFPAPPKNAQQETIWKSLGIDPIVASSTALLCFSLLSAAWLVHSNHSFHGDWGPPLSSGGWTVIRPNPTHLISSPWFRHELVMQIWLIKSEGKSLEEFSLRISLKLKKKKENQDGHTHIPFSVSGLLCMSWQLWPPSQDHRRNQLQRLCWSAQDHWEERGRQPGSLRALNHWLYQPRNCPVFGILFWDITEVLILKVSFNCSVFLKSICSQKHPDMGV